MGRPSSYTPEIAAAILERLADGQSLRAICRDAGMPSEAAVRGWALDDVDGFSARYARARDIGLDSVADEILTIADTPVYGQKTKTDAEGNTETTIGDMIEHRRLQVDSRKWYLSKLAPKRYGDRQALELSGEVGIATALVEARKRAGIG